MSLKDRKMQENICSQISQTKFVCYQTKFWWAEFSGDKKLADKIFGCENLRANLFLTPTQNFGSFVPPNSVIDGQNR